MTRLRAGVLAAVTVLAGALFSAPTTATAAGGGEPDERVSGRQVFILVQTDPTGDGGPIAARGPIHAKGLDVVTGEFTDRFEFPDGNVFIRHRPKAGSSVESFDPVTCLFTFSERGTWTALPGTRAYDDVKGHGHYRVFGQGFGCDESQPPESFFVRIRAVGHLSY